MKVRVDSERCQGHTLCSIIAPEVFEPSEIDGHSTVVKEDVPPELESKVVEAVNSCPERAISTF
ncbi:ferredoxin [Actinomadura chokoriensis]|uniref:Ferredoxin n=1 Tax=Actinomadura chokoriensis TaxID=454156 RepID=A0ABV4QTG7_9ACTN